MACASLAMCSVSVAAPSAAASSCSLSGSVSSRVRFHVKSTAPSVRPLSRRSYRVVAMASGPGELVGQVAGQVKRGAEDLVEMVKQSITSAQEVCEGNETSEECVVAWDEVEELSAAVAHKRVSKSASSFKDPLEKYCEDNPETDECRVYED